MKSQISTLVFAVLMITSLWSINLACGQVSQNQWSAASFVEPGARMHNSVEVPPNSRFFHLETSLFENQPSTGLNEFQFPIPLPSNGELNFKWTLSDVMHPDLALKFPMIKTWLGKCLDDPKVNARMVWTGEKLHAFVSTPEGDFTIEKLEGINSSVYISSFLRDRQMPAYICEADETGIDHNPTEKKYGKKRLPSYQDLHKRSTTQAQSVGTELRTYRLALAFAAEITQSYGGINATMARATILTSDLNLFFESELCINFQLVPNNDLLIYDNPATDPYSGQSLGGYLLENVALLDSVIGGNNFDVGHVIKPIYAGVAYVGVFCENYWKGGGVSPDDIYVVVHEMGHQLDAHHTFNACGGTGPGPGGWEPGSGNTSMSYHGNCGWTNMPGPEYLQYHAISYTQIHHYIHNLDGDVCPVKTPTGNIPPIIAPIDSDFHIPILTPFALTASVTDDGGSAPLTYAWEQNDQGNVENAPYAPVGSAPIFRSYGHTSSPSRTFPDLQKVINGTSDWGEVMPFYDRELNFRVTVHDNNPGAGGVSICDTKFYVEEDAGPFEVTNPSVNAIPWSPGQSRLVEWDVANTDAAPVSCSIVNILISYDGGYNYPDTLASAVPNDGQEMVIVPNQPGSQTRVKVEAADNIFFDISNENFTIVPTTHYDFAWRLEPVNDVSCNGSSVFFRLQILPLGQFSNPVDISITGLPSGTSTGLPAVVSLPFDTVFSIDGLGAASLGSHSLSISLDEVGGSLSFGGSFELFVQGNPDPVPGNAMFFDGVAQAYVPHHPDYRFGTDQNFTLECWFKTTTTSPDDAILGAKDWDLGHLPGWIIAIQNGQLTFNVADGLNRMDVTSTATYNDGEWHHVAAVFDRSGSLDQSRLYVDGHEVASGVGNLDDITHSTGVRLGIGMDGRWDWEFEGTLDEVRIWRKALTAEEIREGMHHTFSTCESGLISYHQFNQASGAAVDLISSHDAIVNGAVRVPSTCPVGPGSAKTEIEAQGLVQFAGTGVSAEYHLQDAAFATASRISLSPHGTSGVSFPSLAIANEYWILNRYERFGSFSAQLSIHLTGHDVSVDDECSPGRFQLYSRPFNSDGVWSLNRTAVLASELNDIVTFDSVDVAGQYLLAYDSTYDAGGGVVLDVLSMNVSCANCNDGSAWTSVVGGTAPYSYVWDNTQTDDTLNNLGVGTYSVTVTDANGCSAEGSVSLAAPACVSPTNVVPVKLQPINAVIRWDDVPGVIGYELRIRSIGSANWIVRTSYNSKVNLNCLLSPETTYEYEVRSYCTAVDISSWSIRDSFTTPELINYCIPSSSDPQSLNINQVCINQICKNSGNQSLGFEDFSCITGQLFATVDYNLSLRAAAQPNIGQANWSMWIDYNHDGDFQDANETVFSQGPVSSALTSGMFTVPASACNGSTRMRVQLSSSTNHSCAVLPHGQTEDYTVVIVNGQDCNSIGSRLRGDGDNSPSLRISPNPTSGSIRINYPNVSLNSSVILQVVNSSGKTVEFKTIEPEEPVFDHGLELKHLPSGVYFLKVTQKEFQDIQKLIVY